MTGREMEAQRREIFGARVGYCDLCGAAAPLTELREIDGGPMAYGADFEPTVICQGCLERIYKGELDLEGLLIEEDDRRMARELVAW
ncbi:MAG TPA: hypothetical protein VKZ96_04735 [Thermomicrobiales bacterium]|nr:hypothetical protein [Thermomicrobiales bacterium]